MDIIGKCRDGNDAVRSSGYEGLSEYVKINDNLPRNTIEEIFQLFISGMNDDNDDVRVHCIFGLSKMVERDLIVDDKDKINELTEFFILYSDEYDNDARNSLIWTISKVSHEK